MEDAYANGILEHYQTHWGANLQYRQWTKGPFHQLPDAFRVIEVPPNQQCRMWTYATCCMSQPQDAQRREMLLYSPEPSEQHVELLTVTSHYHRTGASLDHYHTVNFGRPWLPGSVCSYGLLSWPYLEPPAFACHQIGERELRFIWLIPITEAERDFKAKSGIDALEEAFEKANLNYLDPARASVV